MTFALYSLSKEKSKGINFKLVFIVMKNILFLVMAIALFGGCGKEELPPLYTEMVKNVFKSKDSIHVYFFSGESMIKQRVSDKINIWEKGIIKPNNAEIDLGYGKKETIDFVHSNNPVEGDNYIFVIWCAKSSVSPYSHIGLYSLSGDFIANTKGDYLMDSDVPIILELTKNKLLVFSGWNYRHGYYILDNNLNIIEHIEAIDLHWLGKTVLLDEERYITYDHSTMEICDLKGSIIDLEIDKYIYGRYPNEENKPKYKISDVSVANKIISATASITLYNGEKNTLKIKINSDTGEISQQ